MKGTGMRFTTRLAAFVTLLVALAMFLMLCGVLFSVVSLNKQTTNQHLQVLSTSIDQQLLRSPPSDLAAWLPQSMRTLGIVDVKLLLNRQVFFHQQINQEETGVPEGSDPEYLTVTFPLLQHPGMRLVLVRLDAFGTNSHSVQAMLPISLVILLMVIVLLFSFRWLSEQLSGLERLDERALRILRGERQNISRGDINEWPANVSGALDQLLSELDDVREQRSRVDTLIRAYAQQDGQTGLSNRLFFDNQLAIHLEEQGAYGILMLLRLPDFDVLRENYGRSRSEELRLAMVNLLATFAMRFPAALLARYFHSDFTVLLPHSSLKEAETMASQLVNALSMLPPMRKIDRESLLYIGICSYRHGQSAEQLMNNVEQATRHAAFQGSNGWFVYDNKVPERGRGSVKWRTLLENTLVRGGPRLYQRSVMNSQGGLDHRDIQRRIFDGEQELLATEFMPLVTQFGLAENYDRRMIAQVIPLLDRWPQDVLAFHLTVDSLLQRSFVRWLRDILLQCGKKQRARIMIEIAESDLCQHLDRLQPAIRLITGLGCRLGVSLAGLTVVSSSYLKLLPVSRVILHPGLSRNINKRIENQLFVESLISACAGFQTRVYASGVLTREEWLALLEKGVHGGQGDFFAVPQVV